MAANINTEWSLAPRVRDLLVEQQTGEQAMAVVAAIGDGVLATAVITSPFWLDLFESAMHIYLVLGGAILITFRIRKAWKDRNKES